MLAGQLQMERRLLVNSSFAWTTERFTLGLLESLYKRLSDEAP